MKKLILLISMFGIITGMVNGATLQGNQNVVGEWKYEVPTAPYGYQKGMIRISQNNGVLSGVVTFDSGNKVQLKTATVEGDILKLGLYVESEYVSLEAKTKGSKMEGMVDSSQGKMAFKAEKK